MNLQSYSKFYKIYSKNRPAVAGLLLISALLAIACLAQFIAPYDFYDINAADMLQPPSSSHLMGTDNLGRDIISGIIYGGRISLLIGFTAAGISAMIGTLTGSIAGYYGGKWDSLLMRITELFMVIPTFFLILVIIAVFGGSIWNVMVVIGLTSWPGTARLIRSEVLSLKNQEFVDAARTTGASDPRILFRHIIPNALYPVLVNTSIQVAGAILSESGLSFLGLGDPNNISWGQMLNNSQGYLRTAWWMAAFPGVAILLSVLSFNLIGDGLNDAMNPRLRRR